MRIIFSFLLILLMSQLPLEAVETSYKKYIKKPNINNLLTFVKDLHKQKLDLSASQFILSQLKRLPKPYPKELATPQTSFILAKELKLKNHLTYLQARQAWELGKYKQAAKLFKKIKETSPLYQRSQIYLSNLALKERKYQQALNLTPPGKYLLRGRIHYSNNNFAAAINSYAQIPRNHNSWRQGQFEAAWTFLRMRKPQNSLGNLHTVQAPFFQQHHLPEALILDSLNYLRLCYYKRSREVLEDFSKRYVPLLKTLKTKLPQWKNRPDQLRDLVRPLSSEDKESSKALPAFLHTLSQSSGYQLAQSQHRQIKREMKILDGLGKSRKVLLIGLKKLEKQLEARLAQRLYRQAQNHYQKLLELFQQSRLLHAELLLGKIDLLRSQLKISSVAHKQNFIGGMQELKVGQSLEYWPYEGEYWENDLGGYIFNIPGKCRS